MGVVKLVCFLLLLICAKGLSQTFGKSPISIYPAPLSEKYMMYYKWYNHPEEENIYIINFERNIDGFTTAFKEVRRLLAENNLKFEETISNLSSFHPDLDSEHSYEELHSSVKDEKSKIFMTWNSGKDFLTLFLKHDIYMLILGNKKVE